MHRRETQVQLWASLDVKKPHQQREMIALWTWWVFTQETAALMGGGPWGYNFGIGRIKVETEALDNLGRRRSWKCYVKGTGGAPDRSAPGQGGEHSGSSRP